jgi:hypothetical protein
MKKVLAKGIQPVYKHIIRYKFIYLFIVIILSIIAAYPAYRFFDSRPSIPSRKKFAIAIFREEGFPSEGTPDLLNPEWLYKCLLGRFSVEYVDTEDISDVKRFNAKKYNLLILPYGEAFVYETFPYIKDYLFSGGGLMNIAGTPFWSAREKVEGMWRRLNIDDPYGEFLSPLGIKYYEPPGKRYTGLSVTTSSSHTPVMPTHGNVFPYRIPARDFYFAKGGNLYLFPEDVEHETGQPPVIIVKHWMNPYAQMPGDIPSKWALIGAKGENHPFNPKDPSAKSRLIEVMELLSFPVIMHCLESEMAIYRQGEDVRIALDITNPGKVRRACSVKFEFFDESGAVVYIKEDTVTIEPESVKPLHIIWQPAEFKSNFYRVVATLTKKGKILDKAANGFAIKRDNMPGNSPSIAIRDNIFLINGEPSYILGVNYYESKLGELMWLRPDMLRIRRDLRAMSALGINFVRLHYHHSKWFRDYLSKVAKTEPGDYFNIADTTALPSERSLRIIDAIIQMAQEQGLIFCIDIFSLIPEEMGEPIGWLGLKERINCPEKVKIQKDFIRVLAQRYKHVEGIVWDLWNEPRLGEEDTQLLRGWAAGLKKIFRENGAKQPITIGGNLSLELLDVLDYACVHTYHPLEFVSIKGLGKPFIFGEIWNDVACGMEEEIMQAEKLKKDFKDFQKTQAAGFVPWQWTRQARLWNNKGRAETWDDELGLCVRDDGSLKPAGRAYSYAINLFRQSRKKT